MHKKILMILVFVFWVSPALAEMIVDTAWVRRYSGGGSDEAHAIAVDGYSNVYVTGTSGTINYDTNGNQLWVGIWPGADIAIDTSNNVYVTGGIWEYVTVKYYSDGDTAWVRRYNGPGNFYDYPTAIAVDSSGNVYVTGYSFGSGTEYDYATVKYYSNGDTAWVRRYNGPADGEDWAYAIAVDDFGNVYVTGHSYRNDEDYDYTTIRYYSNGDTAWIRRYIGPGSLSGNKAYAIAIYGRDNIYVTGRSYGGDLPSGTAHDYATIKYDSSGNELWVKRYHGPGNGNDMAVAIDVDNSGNAFVTGYSYGSWTYSDYATIKYYPNGDTAWVRRYNGPGDSSDVARAMAIDGSGNVYVTGWSYGSETLEDYATIKYDSSGNELWVKRYSGPPGYRDIVTAIAIDNYNNVYVTGYSSGYSYATIKYFQALRGDADGDGVIDIADVVYLINYLFIDGPAPEPLEAGNANCDGMVDIADVVYLINYLFIDGPPPDCE
ncbi:MAG: SBBP repeat-containing protein [Candidatus Zixiibacteriota bacterium]